MRLHVDITTLFSGTSSCVDEAHKGHSCTEHRVMFISIIVMLTLYGLLFIGVIFNIYRYVIRQQRFKTFHIVSFYVLTSIIIILRSIFFAILDYRVTKEEESLFTKNIMDLDNFATYCELTLGVQQLCSMAELYCLIRVIALTKKYNMADTELPIE